MKIYQLIIIATSAGVCLARDAQIVDNWATSLGSELWDLANAVARPDELKTKYKNMNARVEDKSGTELIEIISESVGRMLRRKMDAVRCILKVAEDAAEKWDLNDDNDNNVKNNNINNLTYVSSKYSPVVDKNGQIKIQPKIPEKMKSNAHIYRNMTLNEDSHFYNIPVNTNYSSVHIPTNVYDLLPPVVEAISWSEQLDQVFRQNYQSDPALSWQYFGSTTGMLRQYPAMKWQNNIGPDGNDVADLYDCRIRSWFIEAATCSKDMVILVDSSGSMEGMGYTIAKAVVSSILDTLSNNDYVTILEYKNTTQDIVPCFKDKLVQATPENINTFKESMSSLNPLEVANLTDAFISAFTILETYRISRGCGPSTPCNQLIMLVTDGVASNISQVFYEWNRDYSNINLPVRVFTYLLGKEVTNVREIQLMACENRGYYTHVHTQEEAQEQVLKYIPVVARPLVLQQNQHPVAWTHAYTDTSNPALAPWLWLVMNHQDQKSRLDKHLEALGEGVRINDDAIYIKQIKRGENGRFDPSEYNLVSRQEYQLLTSVSIPAFDRKVNKNNITRRANLLGVAGTDVPIRDIEKLTLPYKLGINGYAFIVSNNGYVILHPDLRPVSGEKLKENYNSVDLTEVEILDDDKQKDPRKPGQDILKLRKALVDHQTGSMKNVPVKLHYDDNKRVTLEKRDYYYAPLPGTPFGIAIALPNYGKTWIRVGNEIEKNIQAGMNISDLFIDNNWRIHPGWIYCRYHYLEGHEYDKPENELLNFIKMLNNQDTWKWSDQYEAYQTTYENDNINEPNCGRQLLKHDDYYCNEELMQLLVFDARATNDIYTGNFTYTNTTNDDEIEKLVDDYGVFLRFVSTQSGLTRWQPINNNSIPKSLNPNFGDVHRRAINEAWYKGAIYQHQIDPNSIYITVQASQLNHDNDVLTVSMAIFPRDGGKNASAAVVGFQMSMINFLYKFRNITNSNSNNDDDLNCNKDYIDCYLLDQNGYIVLSDAHNDSDTGLFFGTVEGPIMKSMLKQGYYNTVVIYDYQAYCYDTAFSDDAFSIHHNNNNSNNILLYLWKIIIWLFTKAIFLLTQLIIDDLPIWSFARATNDEDLPEKPPAPKEIIKDYRCDQKRTLYIMNQTHTKYPIQNSTIQCSRQFYAQRVVSTNLILVVVNSLSSSCYERLTTEPENILPSAYVEDHEDAACYKKDLNDLPRRRLAECFTEHYLEDEIDACGGATKIYHINIITIVIYYLIIFYFNI
ncbi:hypothetical protein HCN44_008905 [Aphidius gifuensis]|uniref:VWFA domain-containing protein n=1 Tax=Aphidius gifuensis TaxID=684658 RepID=A0A835CQ96_APHGI|nr:voltage-dependent calcium channel subunit alpha-2/delta-3 isoform X2 [Aphidius gifuensis]KAF7991534.1 hypothetical protein HCN44_008905 [Aphidius gifuensis]